MKKIILLIAFTAVSVLHSQIKVEDIKEDVLSTIDYMGVPYIQTINQGDYVVFRYKDMQYQYAVDYKHFILRKTDMDYFYSLLSNLKKDQVGTTKKVTLENEDVIFIKYKKLMGIIYADVSHVDKSGVVGLLRNMTKKQTDKLFLKNQ